MQCQCQPALWTATTGWTDAGSLGSTIMEVHPDGTGAPRKRFAGYRQVPWRMEHQDPPPAADAHTATAFSLSPGQAHDAPEDRALVEQLGPPDRPLHVLMDRAYEGNETRQLAFDLA